MNVPYPGFDKHWGVLASFGIMLIGVTVLYVIFRRKDWL
jgi:magnesium transporter